MKLEIGSGRLKKAGWHTLDANPRCRATYTASIPPLPEEVKEQKWDVIQMIHFIEHIHLWEAKHLLNECHSVLINGGMLALELPNINFAARMLLGQIASNSIPKGIVKGQYDMWAFYGDPSHENPLFCHKWGYSPESLSDELVSAGFCRSNICVRKAQSRIHHPMRDFRIEAIK